MLHVTFLSSFHILGPASEMNQKEDFSSSFKYINLLIDIGEMMIVYRVALEGDIFGFSACTVRIFLYFWSQVIVVHEIFVCFTLC